MVSHSLVLLGCIAGAFAECNTTKGDQCKFPFTYQGKKYRGCTKDLASYYWCAIETTADGKMYDWGTCNLDLGCHVDAGEEIPCDGDDNCCREDRPCGLGEGDCDVDEDCKPGFRCGGQNCPGHSFDGADDCCEENPDYCAKDSDCDGPHTPQKERKICCIHGDHKCYVGSDWRAACRCEKEIAKRDSSVRSYCGSLRLR